MRAAIFSANAIVSIGRYDRKTDHIYQYFDDVLWHEVQTAGGETACFENFIHHQRFSSTLFGNWSVSQPSCASPR